MPEEKCFLCQVKAERELFYFGERYALCLPCRTTPAVTQAIRKVQAQETSIRKSQKTIEQAEARILEVRDLWRRAVAQSMEYTRSRSTATDLSSFSIALSRPSS